MTKEVRQSLPIFLSLLVVAIIGASRLFDPFSGDQALFLTGALSLKHGALLYRDFWDIKQPGIFLFYLLGALIFGFNQVAEHATDLLWQMTFACVLVFALRGLFSSKACASVTALTVVGAYYAGSSAYHLVQVEALAGLPIFGFAWLFKRSLSTTSNALGLAISSGACAGVAVLFKSFFLLVIVSIGVAALLTTRTQKQDDARISLLLMCLAGFLVPLVLFISYAACRGSLAQAYETTIVLPAQIVSSLPHVPIARLADSASRFVLYFRGIIVLSLFALWSPRGQTRSWKAICLAWVVSALAVIVVQEQSWWQYQFLLFVPPIGILAAFGVDRLVSWVRWSPAGMSALLLCGAVAYVAISLPQGAIGTILAVLHARPYASAEALLDYRRKASSEYVAATRDAVAVSVDARQSIFVFGNPLIYVLLDQTQSIAMNAWALQFYTKPLWLRLSDELVAKRPDYVFVTFDVETRGLPENAPAILRLLRSEYANVATTGDGRWYLRRRASVSWQS